MSHRFDLIEVYGEAARTGYAYGYGERRRHTLELIERVAGAGAHVLDVAAAQGNFTLALAERGYEVTWNDLRSELAEYVRHKHQYGTVYYAPGNALELQGEFDLVLMGEVIEHTAHPDEFLVAISRLVKPGGHLVVTTPNGEYFRNTLPRFSDCPDTSVYESMQYRPDADGHIFLLHLDEIKAVAQRAGLEIVEIRNFLNPLTHGHIKLGHVLPLLPPSIVHWLEAATRMLPFARKFHSAWAVLLRKPEGR